MICSNCSENEALKNEEVVRTHFKFNKKAVAIGSGVLAVVLIAATVLGLIFLKPPKNYGMYLKDGQMYYTDFDAAPFALTENLAENMSDSDLLSIGFQLSNRARITKSGELLFFVDRIDENGDGTLCCRFVENSGKDLMIIDTAVQGYSITKNGDKVLYIKDGSLYQFTRKGLKREMIVENITDVRMSNDGEKAVIIDSESRCLFYDVDGKFEEISYKAEEIYHISDDFKTVYFSRDNTAYKWTKGKGVRAVADNVHAIVAAYDSGELYFVRATSTEVLAVDYINDDVKDSDALMPKPAYPLPPAKKDYKTTEEWKADYDIYLGEMDRYYQLMQEYYAKQDRDKIRKQLDGYKITLTAYTLYYYDGKNSEKLSENYNFEEHCRDYNSKKPSLVYSVYINDAKAKFSEISSLEEVESAILACRQSFPKVQLAIGGTVQALTFGVQSADFRFSDNGKTLYFIDGVTNDGTTGSIYTIKIGRTAGEPKLYDKRVDVEQGISVFQNGSIAYYKNVNGTQKGTLYIDEDKVADFVAVGILEYNKNSKSYAFYTDYDGDSQGTLKVLKRGKVKTVSENVHRYSFTPQGYILYLKDYDMETNKGDLYVFDGRKTYLVDTAVTEIVDSFAYGGRNERYY
ncbi:MAG: hypothetical protein E7525_06570 [Ruminococcaceae bacterium]|nr:hypothetical protein [Oscillospiraceae bacterium]